MASLEIPKDASFLIGSSRFTRVRRVLKFTMGNVSSTIRRIPEGHHIDPSGSPSVFHLVESGNFRHKRVGQRARKAIDRSLSQVRICRSESKALEVKLCNEYFMRWDENCDVAEFHGFSKVRLGDLFDKINARFAVTGIDVRPKLAGIQWSGEWAYKVYEFTFGKNIDSGIVYFGMIALGKEKNAGTESYEAVTCLYKLDFTLAKVKVEEHRTEYFLGIPVGTNCRHWWENKSLSFITQTALTNFCRTKALDAFWRQGLVSSVNNVLSIENTD